MPRVCRSSWSSKTSRRRSTSVIPPMSWIWAASFAPARVANCWPIRSFARPISASSRRNPARPRSTLSQYQGDTMIETIEADNSGYAFMPGVSQYSCGIGALAGFAIERVRFSRVVPMKQGFAKIAEIIKAGGRPLTAFGACELRSPAPFTEDGFRAFNEVYIKTLIEWGVMKDGVNPVARSNVCPKIDPPSEPGFHAFSFTSAAPGAPASFVVAGSGEALEGKANYRDHIVRLPHLRPPAILTNTHCPLHKLYP